MKPSHTDSNEDCWLQEFVGNEIDVYYITQGFKDRGQLKWISDFWLEIRNSADEIMLIPTNAVRLIKVVSRPVTPSSNLLRPARNPSESDVEGAAPESND